MENMYIYMHVHVHACLLALKPCTCCTYSEYMFVYTLSNGFTEHCRAARLLSSLPLSLPLSFSCFHHPPMDGCKLVPLVSPSSTMTTKADVSLQKLPSFVYHFPSFSSPSVDLHSYMYSPPLPFLHRGLSPIREASFSILLCH